LATEVSPVVQLSTTLCAEHNTLSYVWIVSSHHYASWRPKVPSSTSFRSVLPEVQGIRLPEFTLRVWFQPASWQPCSLL
jgi:hypothetical protein